MRILLLTIGARGDVQPFIALGQRLKQNGHDVALCASSSYSSFVERQGLEYRYLNNDLVELAQGQIGRKAMEDWGSLAGRLRWMAEAARLFNPNFRKTLREEWEAAQGKVGTLDSILADCWIRNRRKTVRRQRVSDARKNDEPVDRE